MKLGDFLSKELIIPELSARTKKAVLAELVAAVHSVQPELDETHVLDVLLEREALGTTGIGDGIAIPHGKIAELESVLVVVGRSAEGVEFDALDFEPCKIFFLVLAPEKVAGVHLRVLAHISRMLKEEDFRQQFLSASEDELKALLFEA
ncbi:PTS sugar transporter subunit IIA [Desulfobaculum bizertense]|uniref:PTS IIA-like nitrogen-regulatory protein PtsN n=1 Tax=Desulfobaculum bizertense DSM 18034 TaxID=1121442 RepID=A0A1T4W3J0_9BACT|nr:PTS sugar transporter subunit IIA [Desulfobaculum bizertense]UIJ38759.1 PTS sugar transporter subunit IIA [Desulfobaculum bizertense]SKA71874.1 PTS IIA-like nitrogen-regulatory protein PtsN [Desulfobaculum bizertense DSM 18034]